jgi:hypothetical protein
VDASGGFTRFHRYGPRQGQKGRLHVCLLLRFQTFTDVISGFGSIVVSDPEEMTRCVVDAVVNSGCYAILSKGWSDRGSKKEETDDSEGADGVKYPPEI